KGHMVLSGGTPMMGYPWYSEPGNGGEFHGDGIARRFGSLSELTVGCFWPAAGTARAVGGCQLSARSSAKAEGTTGSPPNGVGAGNWEQGGPRVGEGGPGACPRAAATRSSGSIVSSAGLRTQARARRRAGFLLRPQGEAGRVPPAQAETDADPR